MKIPATNAVVPQTPRIPTSNVNGTVLYYAGMLLFCTNQELLIKYFGEEQFHLDMSRISNCFFFLKVSDKNKSRTGSGSKTISQHRS